MFCGFGLNIEESQKTNALKNQKNKQGISTRDSIIKKIEMFDKKYHKNPKRRNIYLSELNRKYDFKKFFNRLELVKI
jgi:hypothetical protein